MASSDDAFVAPSLESKNQLQTKHPVAPIDRRASPSPTAEAVSFSEADVRRAIFSFAAGSAGGPSGLRPQHLKDSISSLASEAGNQLASTLCQFVNYLMGDSVPTFIKPVLASATLISLAKKPGGILPIAIGDTLRRLASKCVSRKMLNKFKDHFAPVQLGAGTKNGCEAGAHAARNFIAQASCGNVFVKIDFANAFNTVRRDHILETIADKAPEVLNFVKFCYENHSFLLYGDHVIVSAEGFQQGDPLATFSFCLAIHPLILKINSYFKCGYLDDVSFGDKWQTALDDLKMIQHEAAQIGLLLNEKKCEVTAFGNESPSIYSAFKKEFPSIQCVDPDDTALLGAGLGQKAIRTELANKLEGIRTLIKRTEKLSCQAAFFLIKNCFFIPKLMFILRSSPAFYHLDLLQAIDGMIKIELERIFNCIINDRSFKQITLPVKLSGFGVLSTATVSSSAFIASMVATASLRHELLNCNPHETSMTDASRHWELISGSYFAEQDLSSSQKVWLKPVFGRQANEVLSEATSELDAARVLGCQAIGSGEWTTVLPSRTLGLTLSDNEFQIAAGLRIGAPVTAQFQCKCGYVASPDGRHPLVCPKIKHRFTRHNNCNIIIKESLRTAGFSSTLEPIGLLRSDGRRPDGLALTSWQRGCTLAWDFTCVSRLASSNMRLGVLPGSNAASQAEIRKKNHYSDLPTTVIFEPVAIESLGGIGRSSLTFLQNLARKIRDTTGEVLAFKYLRQRLDLAIQRGNAGCILEAIS